MTHPTDAAHAADPLAALRAATATRHERLDSNLPIGAPDASLHDYAAHLAMLRAWLGPLHAWLAGFADGPRFDHAPRLALIDADLCEGAMEAMSAAQGPGAQAMSTAAAGLSSSAAAAAAAVATATPPSTAASSSTASAASSPTVTAPASTSTSASASSASSSSSSASSSASAAGADTAAWPLGASAAYRWGVCYVIEGSQLGGAVLYQRLHERLAPHPLRYLKGDAAGPGPRWRAFMQALRASVRTETEVADACAGACAAFDAILALGHDRPGRPIRI